MKVYVYKYVWENGRKFEGGAGVRVFANKENASATLKRDIDEYIKSFMLPSPIVLLTESIYCILSVSNQFLPSRNALIILS